MIIPAYAIALHWYHTKRSCEVHGRPTSPGAGASRESVGPFLSRPAAPVDYSSPHAGDPYQA